ncbi:hypothetical protein HYW42_00925 [Candidatus Daviesbacteria bacterium]|nr:hypothetical protein [Candidatus Daviesbacteria bacterium]
MNTIPKINKNIQEQDAELMNDKKFIFMVCNRCGWAGIATTFSKKYLSRPKCPSCK